MDASPTYRYMSDFARWGLHRIAGVRVEGVENVPAAGPCVLLPNHQSALDPVLVQGECPREVHTVTKSTQFVSPAVRWILCQGRAFSVRRYRVDPQAVRVLLRRLEEGHAVCLYPEGERSWDGRLQPFRRGALRVLLRAGVPLVPVGIEGMYEVWPRWASRPRLGQTVHLRFGAPLEFGPIRDRRARQAALPELDRTLRDALLELSGAVRPEDGGAPEPSTAWPEALSHPEAVSR